MPRKYKNLFFDLDDTLCSFPVHTGEGVSSATVVWMPHVHEALEYLSGRYRLYILSNGSREVQVRKIQRAGLAKYFRQTIVSEDIGVPKPHAPIFHFALSATQSHLEDSLMIGDNWEKDVEGAAGVGMDQVFYDTEGFVQTSFCPTYYIRDLKELMHLL